MTPQASPQRSDNRFLKRLQAAAIVAGLVGAVGSFSFMLRAGRRNGSLFLMVIMTVWVLSPFVALAWANLISKGWPVLNRTILYGVMLVLTVASLAVYGVNAVLPPKAQAAFVFVVVPPLSWLLMAIAGIAALQFARRSRRGPVLE